MKIRVTLEFDDYCRKAIANQTGQRIASRHDIKTWVDAVIESSLEDLALDYEQAVRDGRAKS